MTGKQLYERAQELNVNTSVVDFDDARPSIQTAWKQLAQDASVNVADELGSNMQHERFGI